jgi:FdhE protein
MASYASRIACLQEAARTSPEYAAILPLFIGLFRYLEEHGERTGIAFRISRDRLQERLGSGFPLVSPADLSVDMAVCTEFLSGAIAVLRQFGKEGSADLNELESALRGGALDQKALFGAILERNRSILDVTAQNVNVPAALLEYLLEIPLKAALEQVAAGITPGELDMWSEGYCPVCGSRAGMAELSGEEGRRHLSCSACTYRWPFKRMQCPFCGTEDGEKLSYFMTDAGATRVDTCKACSRYIKTRDARKGAAEMPLDVADLLTIHLDLLATREGFERGK